MEKGLFNKPSYNEVLQLKAKAEEYRTIIRCAFLATEEFNI